MEARPLKYIAEASGAEMLSGAGELLVSDVCTDSRQAKAGDVFFAIEGEKFDGHNFLSEVAAKNVAAVVVQQRKAPASLPGCAVLAVENPRLSLGKLAAAYRREFSLPIVTVGGSNGKTTTKELLASVLRQRLSTLWSEASFNN
ncbi:MAG TPA: Mur ligase domain-containing protein, partial [Candidatus Acidoferrum sp.]|nr:Mur ligase domain-containing protein [Candidatus Acidoferrum sp.]